MPLMFGHPMHPPRPPKPPVPLWIGKKGLTKKSPWPVAAVVPPPAAPVAAAAAPAAPEQPAVFVPDAQYLAEAGQRAFDRQNKIGDLTTQGAQESQDLQEAVRRMLGQRTITEQQTRQTANKQGLFYSGQLGKRLGAVATDYTQRQADTQNAFDRRQAARDAARRAIEAGAPLEEAAAIAQSVDRQIARDQEAADAGVLAGTPAAAKPAAAKVNPAQQQAAHANATGAAGQREATAVARAKARARLPRRPRP